MIDNNWSREETDYLLHLCKEFDLRFPIIKDRYDFINTNRTMEVMKIMVLNLKTLIGFKRSFLYYKPYFINGTFLIYC